MKLWFRTVKSSSTAAIWLPLAHLLLLLACGEAVPATPSIRLEPEGESDSVFVVRGLPESWRDELSGRSPRDRSWLDLLAVHVGSEVTSGERPPMLGRHEMVDGDLRFTPRFPLESGLVYRVRLDLDSGPAPYPGVSPRVVEARFQLPTRPSTVATECEGIFPSGDRLPENLLRLYLQFSGPMSRGVSEDHISLEILGRPSPGRPGPAPDPFVEIAQELWDPEQRRLTLLLDPGRIKRGLRPHDEAGPPLVAGTTYRLAVSADWPDSRGELLVRGCEKTFQVVAPDRVAPAPDLWRIEPPPAGSREPLRLHLDSPLDHSLLTSQLAVEGPAGPAGPALTGEIRVTNEETVWSFYPHTPWAAGSHKIHIGPALEDPAGNRIGKIFDQPMESPRSAPSAPEPLVFVPAPPSS